MIEIHNRLDESEYLRTLFHELVHVKQFVRGELKDKRSKKYWKDEDISDIEYNNDPSEIEALQMEDLLYESFTNLTNL
jgi:predicted metallopeptidase|tara:strand:- start:224 stop:457 length:234 start_codon:yes stop_codon:yes gene_type:complete